MRMGRLVALAAIVGQLVWAPAPSAQAEDHVIHGIVTDAAGHGLGGITVSAESIDQYGRWSEGATVVTATDGHYDLDLYARPVNTNVFEIRFTDPSGTYGSVFWHDATTNVDATRIDVGGSVLLPEADQSLAPASTVAGVVTDPTGAPVPRVLVTLYGLVGVELPSDQIGADVVDSVYTDDAGRYRFGTVPVGTFRIGFSTRDLDRSPHLVDQFWDRAPTLQDATNVVVDHPSSLAVADAVLSGPTHLRGRVSGPDGAGVRTTVDLEQRGDRRWELVQQTSSAPDGTYDFSDVSPGRYRLLYHGTEELAGQYFGGASSIDDASDVVVGVGVDTTDVDASLVKAATIAGRLTDEQGDPVSYAQVATYNPLDGSPVSTFTDDDGRYRISGLIEGDYRLRLYGGSAFVPQWYGGGDIYDYMVPDGDVLRLRPAQDLTGVDAVLTRGGSVSGTITNDLSDEGAEEYVSVTRLDADGEAEFSRAEPAGPSIRVDQLRPGTYVVELYDTRHVFTTQYYNGAPTEAEATRVHVVAGQTTVLDPITLDTRRIQLLAAPQLIGDPGDALYVTRPAWSPDGVVTTYQWKRDGVVVPNAVGSSYRPVAADVGHVLTVVVTGSSPGLAPVEVVLGPRDVTIADDPAYRVPPRVSGDPTRVLYGHAGRGGPWDTDAIGWARDGAPIAGATSSSYRPVMADRGHHLTYVVTFYHPDGSTTRRTSAPVLVPQRFVVSGQPRRGGQMRVGSTLTVIPPAWSPAPDRIRYQWVVDGRVVPRATGAHLRLLSRWAGDRVAVRVSATRNGYVPTHRDVVFPGRVRAR